MKCPAHITVNGEPLCTRMGCVAFTLLEQQIGRTFTCDYLSTRQAQLAAKALRPHYLVPVNVVAGACPKA